ncbi:MAG: glycoside hydrolase family 130 protein [Candidatus Omnitrophica bacterium]|nr:glycoside hydrolase family 130 protein [Candidatus Omnitrophota bacterium]
MSTYNVKKINKIFRPDPRRVITKAHIPQGNGRIEKIIRRVSNLSDKKAKQLFDKVMTDFSSRHKNFLRTLDERYNEIKKYIPKNVQISDTKKLLLGAYFTLEYSVQAAAFFNPSIVEHPNQSDLPKGSKRFILSFRSVGEGHISSIEFRRGVISKKSDFTFDEVSPYVERATTVSNPVYDKHTFFFKLSELGVNNEFSGIIAGKLQEQFSLSDLKTVLRISSDQVSQHASETILWLAMSNYELQFKLEQKISERIIFPCSQNDSNGIEDARFVRFIDDDGSITYYATYTAYNGFKIMPQILETKDFLDFKIVTLNGQFAGNKGMALFPRKINGKYMMISRFDGENLFLMSSDNIYFWPNIEMLKEPQYDWEFVQIGNCGSPIETEKGWIVLTHGVGAMRKYCIGAILLDLTDPSKVIGSTAEPILSPTEEEREGYVPNVVYSCGAMIHEGNLIIPYAMSDTNSGIATVPVDELLNSMMKTKK